MGRRGGSEAPQLPTPPPIFFLQVPRGVAATTNEEGLSLPPLGASAGAPVAHERGGGASAVREGEEEGSAAERGIGRRRCVGEEGGFSNSISGVGSGSGAGSSSGSGSGAGRFGQPSGDITRAASSDGRRCVLPPPPPPQPVGKFVPHLVLVSLNAEGKRGRAARVVRAAAMDSLSAKQVRHLRPSPTIVIILCCAPPPPPRFYVFTRYVLSISPILPLAVFPLLTLFILASLGVLEESLTICYYFALVYR